jgi:flagellar basal-body rod protein FlgC
MANYAQSIFKNFFSSLNISGAGLTTQRKRLDMISLNIANVNTIKTEDGGPYQRRVFIQEAYDDVNFKDIFNEKELLLKSNNLKHIKGSPYYTSPEDRVLKSVKGSVELDPAEPIKIFDPNHPEADEEGYILKPNINVMTEMVDLIAAQKEFEANITVMNAYKSMIKSALNI